MAAPTTAVKHYFLSDLLKARVRREGDSAPEGRLRDIGFQKSGPFPPAVCIEVGSTGRAPRTIGWQNVLDVSAREVIVRLNGDTPPPVDFWLRRDVLDDQVVDFQGVKVRRVNDVELLYSEGKLVPTHVEVGTLGILRRLGVERPVTALLRWLLDYTIRQSFVSWRHLEVIAPGGSPGGVRVAVASSRLAELHPADVADILEELGVRERQTMLGRLDAETAAEAIEEMTPDVQRTVITQQDPGKAADILEEMPPYEAADVLRDIHTGDAERIMGRMESEAAQDVRDLLAHDERTASGMMTISCVEARANQTAAEVLNAMRPLTDEVTEFNIVYVVDEARRLVGVVSLRDLLGAAPDTTVESLMITRIVKVSPRAGLRELGQLFAKYGIRAIPVVDDEGTFLGTVRLKDVLYELVPQLRE